MATKFQNVSIVLSNEKLVQIDNVCTGIYSIKFM